jgi:hypothetical protein
MIERILLFRSHYSVKVINKRVFYRSFPHLKALERRLTRGTSRSWQQRVFRHAQLCHKSPGDQALKAARGLNTGQASTYARAALSGQLTAMPRQLRSWPGQLRWLFMFGEPTCGLIEMLGLSGDGAFNVLPGPG